MAWLESQDYFTSGKLKNYKKASAPAPVKVVPSIPVKGTGIKIVPAADDDLIPSSVPTKVAPTSTLKPVPTPVQSATDKPSDVPTSSPAIKRKWIPNQSDKTPPMAGQKPLPEGADLCLTGLTFVVTGVLDSLDRDQAHDLISRFGGRHTSAVSGKTSYLLCGMEPGESKVSEAHAKNVPIVDEDGLFDLIRTLPEGGKAPAEKTTKSKEKKSREIPAATTVKSDPSASASPAVSISAPVVENKPTPSPAVASSPATSLPSVKSTSSPVAAANPFSAPRANPFGAFGGGGNFSASAAKAGAFSATAAAASPFSRPNAIISSTPFSSQSSTNSAVTTPVASSLPANDASTSTLLWVDKYKPTRVDQLVGMGGIAQKLTEWLRGWEDHWLDSNRQADSDDDAPATKKPRTAAAALTGLRENSKAVLLSGPPGVGKTSCANLVAQQLGYDVIALNASDSRSKKVIKEQFGHLVQNRSMSQFFTGSKQKAVSKRTMLIMDEVDGMGGGDRGGISELILMIRRAQMPIVCIANDRGKQALKSLINYCYDLRVNKPHDQSVAKRLATIAQNEGMHIEPNALEGISAMTHGDLRQAINLLYMWRRKNGNMKQTDLKGLRDSSMKDMDKGVWNIAPVFFQRPKPSDNKWTDERIEAFFNDTMFMPGYVQDTYVTSRGPVNGSKQDTIKHLFALAEAADSMSEATLVHRRVYSSQDYTLSQFHGFMACIRPGMSVAGTVSGNQFGFPRFVCIIHFLHSRQYF
jgi:replication factor C subunit 1